VRMAGVTPPGTSATVAEPVVARVKDERGDGIGEIPKQARRIRKRQKMSNETLIVISVLAVLAAGIGIYAIYSALKDDSPTRTSKKRDSSDADRDRQPSKSKPKKTRPRQTSRDSWVDAASSPAQIGAAKVSIIRAFAGPLPGVPGVDEYLFVQVRVRNTDVERPLEAERWESWAGSTFRHKAVATDGVGNLFPRRNPFGKTLTTGKTTLAPNERVDQFLVFERPPAGEKTVRLLLAGSATGASRSFRFEVPASMISTANDAQLAWLYSTLPDNSRPDAPMPVPGNVDPVGPDLAPTDPVEAAVGVKPKPAE
ncbi:MAG: hypothetical protein MI757_00160, partial [Pirellulales bacterium]|nr:hypothetical protein [Pirellulales bacterium]